MRFRSRTLGLLSILLIVASVWFWLRGNEEIAKRNEQRKASAPTPSGAPVVSPGSNAPLNSAAAATPSSQTATQTTPAGTTPSRRDGFPYRLRNTEKSVDELGRLDSAILLDNAFIDTSANPLLAIPDHLKSKGDPGSYVIQYRGSIDPSFYAQLKDAGAEFVSYIPNNAALVRATSDQAVALAASPRIQAVLRYEPYYKIARSLMPLAVEQEPLPSDQMLNVVTFADQPDKASEALAALGAKIVAEDRTPFGPMFTIQPHPDSIAAMAGLPEVQRIEPAAKRELLNDLTRVRVGVSTNTVVGENVFDPVTSTYLTGSNVVVNVNDTGVDMTNPDLAGRVFTTTTNAFALFDFNGHGTHVGGTIASTGDLSSTVTGADGSVPGANFRGKAPAANLFVLPIDLQAGPLVSDAYLQETAANQNYVVEGRTTPMISNNSWGYPGAYDYSSISASYDSAVRDALPGMPGSQSLIYVFAAGNSGFGTTNGVGGDVGTILTPANAKNVIAVGALESPRGLTNEAFAGYTDSDDEVAAFSSRGNVGVGTEGAFGRFKPDVVAPGTFIVSTRSTNAFGTLLDLGPYYRYETGTSMAAPAISGLLALIQEHFQSLAVNYSPALVKALLINGSRGVSSTYDLRVRKALNYQGWGLANLTNSIPELGKSSVTTNASVIKAQEYVDSGAAGAITTGESHSWNVDLGPRARTVPFRVTLVWTDPPGNPGAAVKLVNNLDLVVTNLATGEVFVGNNIPLGADFTASDTTNSVADPDFVNNVENVFLSPPLGTNYSVTVKGRRVNVNAVTANTTGIVQDYALVLTSGNGEVLETIEASVPDGITSFTAQAVPPFLPPLISITNGVPFLKQKVGANFQLVPSTNGTAAQWSFFAFTNFFSTNNAPGMTNGSNVAFATFLPPNSARPRNFDADIDLYVSRDPQLTNLNPAAVTASSKSLHRGGTEVVVFTNSPVGPDVVYYVGVKSEDQQASEYGIVALSSQLPFDSIGPNGSRILRGYPSNVPIPDGSPSNPGGALVFAIGVLPIPVGGVTAQLQITHESVGDLLGNLSHEDQFVVLNNHNRFADTTGTFYDLQYDDTGSGQSFFSRNTDGPGSLGNFINQSSAGLWLLTMTDDSVGRTGVVNSFSVTVAPQPFGAGGAGVTNTVFANQWNYYVIDVPADGTNLTVCLSGAGSPLNLYLRRGDLPTTTEYDKFALINPPGDCMSLGIRDVPPLNAGRYYIGVFNPTSVSATYTINAVIGLGFDVSNSGQFLSSDTPLVIQDDAVTTSSLFVPTGRPIADLRVGVRIDHPRASDLVLHIAGPQGDRTLLAENRGGDSTQGYGATITTTNVYNGNSSGGPLEDRNVIDTGLTSGTININYDFFQLEDTMHIYYQGVRIYDSGLTNGANSISVNFGPGLSTVVTIVVNEGGSPQPTTAWVYSASIVQEHLIYTTFTDSTNLTTLPIKFATPPFTNSVGMVQTNAVLFDDGFEHATPGAYNVGSYVSGWRVIYGTAIVHGTNNTLGVQPNSGTNFVELVGSPGNPAAVGTNTLLRPDYPFRLTFAYHRNPRTPAGQTNVVAVYTNGVLAQFVYIQPGPWQTATYDFEVNSGAIDLQIRSATPTGALIDSVEISEHADFENRFFLPEEPLKPLMGETALGEWTLELEDNRVGPTSGFPRRLLSWELELTFANTNFPATLLTNCTPQTNVVSVYEPNSCNPLTNSVVLGQIKYFIVDVPRSATMATNLLSGSGDLKLLYSSLGLPTGAFPGDWVQDGPGNTETLILDTNPAPILQLQPGQRYYLGVANVNTNTSNSFVISVAFNSIDTNLLNVIALTNAIPFTRTIPVTNAIDYYQFTVASNATEATFDLLPVNGNVDLVVRKALPVPDPLPRPNPGEFDYISLSTGTNADIIVISQAVQGVPLQPGLYYVGVFNVDTVPVTYSITATARTNVSGLNIIPLTNAVPLNFTIGAGAAMTNFFSFDVTQTNSAVLFELYNLNDIADLLLDYNTYPSPTSWFAAQLGSNGAPAQIVIRTNASVPVVNGRWYLAVDNLQNTNLSFAIRAAVSSTNGMLTSGLPLTVVFTAGTPPYTSVDLEWNSVVGEKYSVETSTDLVTWTPVPGMPITATDIFTTYSDPIVPGQPALFYRVRQVP